MNDPASASTVSSSQSPAGGLNGDWCAVLVLNPTGHVTAANGTARDLWPEPAIVGRAFASLFVFEVTSTDPEFLEAQWEAVLASTRDRVASLVAQRDAATAAQAVRVRLEQNLGAEGYIATIRPPAASCTSANTPRVTGRCRSTS